jgi:hypothetical protein
LSVRGAVLDDELSSKAFAGTAANFATSYMVSSALHEFYLVMPEEGAVLQLDDTVCIAYANRIVLITKGSYLLRLRDVSALSNLNGLNPEWVSAALQHPLVRRVILEVPGPPGAGHDIQVGSSCVSAC